MKNQKIILFILLSYLFVACCDCLDETDPPKPFCSPREATVTKFDPTLIQVVLPDEDGNDSIVYYPTDNFYIAAADVAVPLRNQYIFNFFSSPKWLFLLNNMLKN